jgi:hypothetical protein
MMTGMTTREPSVSAFPLARMDTLNLVLTLFCLGIPFGTLGISFVLMVGLASAGKPGAAIAGAILPGTICLMIVVLFVCIWVFMRPSRFELSRSGLEIVWPGRNSLIPLNDITGAEILSKADFSQRFGRGMRVGAGGLGGGFGLLMTTRGPTMSFYISRVDRFVLVSRVSARNLLITPEDPERFVETLRGLIGTPGARP